MRVLLIMTASLMPWMVSACGSPAPDVAPPVSGAAGLPSDVPTGDTFGDTSGDTAWEPEEPTDSASPADTPIAPTHADVASQPMPEQVLIDDQLWELLDRIAGLPSFHATPGTTEEEWRALEEDAERVLDLAVESHTGEARERLLAAGKAAWPALLNQLLEIDLLEPEGIKKGAVGTQLLSEARGGTSRYGFDWRHPGGRNGRLSPKDRRFNALLVVKLHQTWSKVVDDPTYWRKLDLTRR